MPEVLTYVVTQERELKVSAESPSHAIALAKQLLDEKRLDEKRLDEKPRDVGVRETRIEAREEY